MTRIYFPATQTLNPRQIRAPEIQNGDIYGYKIIASVTGKFWSAYRGMTSWSDQEVAESGDKISESEATLLFPTLSSTLIWND